MKTAYRQQKEARDEALYAEYLRILNTQPGAMKTAIENHLMRKFKIHARATVWSICKRVKDELNNPTTL